MIYLGISQSHALSKSNSENDFCSDPIYRYAREFVCGNGAGEGMPEIAQIQSLIVIGGRCNVVQ